MEKKSRRKFLTDIGLTVGALTIGNEVARALPQIIQQKVGRRPPVKQAPPVKDVIDFKYAPQSWQSTYCFPDDPYKSLVGKQGELLYGHPGIGAELDFFPQKVAVGISGGGEGKFIEQKMEEAGVPIISTKLAFKDCIVTLTSFASRHEDEGRVDNLIIEVHPDQQAQIECAPEIIINSNSDFWLKTDDEKGEVRLGTEEGKLFLAVRSPLHPTGATPERRYLLKAGTATQAKPAVYVVRFPQEGQSSGKIEDGLEIDNCRKLLQEARSYWKSVLPGNSKVTWNLPDEYGNFYTASVRNMIQSREIKEGRALFQVGPTVYRGLWFIDGTFLTEAALYAGYDKEAREGLESMWNRQEADGSFGGGGAGASHWKDVAAPIYALVRHAELTQDWGYFRELYPDAVKAMYYLRDLRDKALNDGTSNGKYKILPRGFGDSGIGGVRSEFTNTLWTLIAINHFNAVARRFFMPRREEISLFYDELRASMREAASQEMRQHPGGFSYLPMLMKEDPQWSDPDVLKQPRPQAAQIYLSQALSIGSQDLFPGSRIFGGDHEVTKGHIALMQAVTKEEIPIETGWMPHDAVWAYNAAVLAQTYLWLGMPDLARKTFIGFLNHASPLRAWREEQPLVGSSLNRYIGDMPHNWASAECIRYLRHMLIFEDGERLRLVEGLGFDDLTPRKPMALTYSPTRWGRVSITLEPLDPKAWTLSFKREDFNQRVMAKLSSVEMPSELPGKFQFDKNTSDTRFLKNGPRLSIDTTVLEWKAVFRDFRRRS